MKLFFRTLVLVMAVIFSARAYAFQQAKPIFDGRNWQLGWSKPADASGSVFDEYVLEGETVDRWTELVTVQFFPGLQNNTNIEVFEGVQKRNLAMVCPSIEWKSHYQTPQDSLYEWHIQNCPGQPDQSEIARVVRTNEGFHVWHYAVKKAPMLDDKRQTWKKNLQTMKAA